MLDKITQYRLLSPVKSLALVALTIGLTFSACQKEEDTIAVVKIVDVVGEPVAGAFVELYAEPTETEGQAAGELIDKVVQQTDAAGEAVFDFTESYQEGQAGFAVLSIDAYKDSLAVEGIIRIDPEMVSEETLILQ